MPVVAALVVEHGGVLAHQAIHGHGLAVRNDCVLGDRVEAEERLGPVQDLQLEHRRPAVHADLRAAGLHQSLVGQLDDRLSDGIGVTPVQAATTDLVGTMVSCLGG